MLFYDIEQIFCMDGLSGIKDLISGTPLTMTGTPATATLLGAVAPVISDTCYTSCSIPTATLGLVPGQPISFSFIVETNWDGDDDLYHTLFYNRGTAPDWILVDKFCLAPGVNLLRVAVNSAAGMSYSWSPILNSTSWAANTPHVIVVTISEDNRQTLSLDGVTWTGFGGYWPPNAQLTREATLGDECYFGSYEPGHEGGTFPLDGSILAAVYGRRLTYFEIQEVNEKLGAGLSATWTDTGLQEQVSMNVFNMVPDDAGNLFTGGGVGTTTELVPAGSGVWKYDGLTWTYTGGPDYFVIDLVYDSGRGVFYAATQNNGIWKYDGVTWTCLGLDGLATNTQSLVYDPVNDFIYVGTAFDGIWQYNIATATWMDTELTGQTWQFDPITETWTEAGVGTCTYAVAGYYDTTHDRVYFACDAMFGVWYYDGATWTDTGADAHLLNVEALAYNTTDDLLYLSTDARGVLQYDGTAWTAVGPPTWDFPEEDFYYTWYQIYTLAWDSLRNDLYAGTWRQGVWRYDGTSWERLKDFPWTDQEDYTREEGISRLRVVGNTLYAGTFGAGVWKAVVGTTARPATWGSAVDLPPTFHKAEKKSAYISILDPTGATPLARLTEHFPVTGWTPDIFENLSFESVNRGGYTVASFSIHRPVTQFWADLQYRNQVIIGRGSEIYWEGYISKPIRSIRPDVIEVNCLGWSAELNQLWTASDITAPVLGYQMSTFINAVLLADPNTSIVAGMIETGDYAYPEGTVFAFAPGTFYFDCIEQLDAGNGYNWGVWGNRAIDLRAKHSSVDWLVWTGDCEDLTISPNPDALCNYALINYTQDGSHYEQVIVQDEISQDLYGIIKKKIDVPGKITTAGATQIANLYLESCKDLKVAAEFTCNRIFDSYGAEQYLGKVRGGEVVRIVDWLPTEETLGGVNDIATFEIKSPKYDHDNDTLAITPTEFLPSTDIQIARLQATGY